MIEQACHALACSHKQIYNQGGSHRFLCGTPEEAPADYIHTYVPLHTYVHTYIQQRFFQQRMVVLIPLGSVPPWACRVPALGLTSCPRQAQEKPNQALPFYIHIQLPLFLVFRSSHSGSFKVNTTCASLGLYGPLWASLGLSEPL